MARPLTVVVPVYNEGSNFRAWVTGSAPYLPLGTEVHVVYDFDEDDTVPVVRELAAQGSRLHLIRNRRAGVLNALLTGFASVPAGPVLVSMADLSDDFAIIPDMLAAYRAGATVVVASRYMKGGRQIGGPWLKGQLSRWGGVSLHKVARFPVHDATNSFRLYDASFVNSLAIESKGGFEIGFEITLKAWMANKVVSEVPCTWRDRTAGESRFNLRKWLPLYARLWARALSYGVLGWQ